MLNFLDLGLNISRFLAAKLAYRNVEQLEHSNQSSFVEYLRSLMQKDIDIIGTQLESQSHSKISSALHYVKRALACAQQDLLNSSESGNQIALFRTGSVVDAFSQDMREYLSQADRWATEAFHDKANVSPKWRLEAVKVQLFAVVVLHCAQPSRVLRMWKQILDELFADKQLLALMFVKSWTSHTNEVKNGIIQLMNNLSGALLQFNMPDSQDKAALFELWNTMLHPTLESVDQQSTWYKNCFVGPRTFCLIDKSFIIITQPFHQFCLLPDNQICTAVPSKDDMSLLLLQIWSNNVMLREITVSRDNQLSYCTVAYDQKRDAVLVVQGDSIRFYDRQLAYMESFTDDMIITYNKHIMCSTSGAWVLCDDANMKVYVRWYWSSTAMWNLVPFDFAAATPTASRSFLSVMDVRSGADDETVEFVIRLVDGSSTKFYLVSFSISGRFHQRELMIENLNLLKLDADSSIFVVFDDLDSDKFIVLWNEGERCVNVLKLKNDGKVAEEHFSELFLPFGLRHVVARLPYIFVGTVPYTGCANELHESVQKLTNSS